MSLRTNSLNCGRDVMVAANKHKILRKYKAKCNCKMQKIEKTIYWSHEIVLFECIVWMKITVALILIFSVNSY